MGWVVTLLRSVTFLDDQTTSKSMQEKLHDGQCHKTKTWNTIWNTTTLNTVGNSLRIHTTLCSRVWPERNNGWKKMFLWMGGCKTLLTKHGQLVQIRLFFPMIFKNKSSPLRRLMPIEILATRPPRGLVPQRAAAARTFFCRRYASRRCAIS